MSFGGITIPKPEEVKYLRIVLDKRLIWKSHTAEARSGHKIQLLDDQKGKQTALQTKYWLIKQ